MTQNITLGGKVAQLSEFNPKKLLYNESGEPLNPRCCMIAPSGSGKSWVLRDMVYHMKEIPAVTVIAPTDKMNKFYDNFIPRSFIHHDYNDAILPKILQRQLNILELNEKRIKKKKKPIDPRLIFIMDDTMAYKDKWKDSEEILTIMNQGRHYQLSYFLTMQYAIALAPELRSNFNFIFLLGEDSFLNREKLYKNFASCIPSFDAFEQIFAQVTKDYGVMVINNNIKSTNFLDKIFWYKAKKTPNFMMGIPKMIKWNKDNYDPNCEKRPSYLTMDDFCKKRRTKINVQMI